jgi:hypothetical protein
MRGLRFGKKQPTAPDRPAFVLDVPTDPMHLASDRVSFMVGLTTRAAIEGRLGPAIEYPARGWRTWASAGLRGDVWLLSAIYRGHVLIGVEHYVGKAESLPRLAPPANGIYKLVPGNIGIGDRITALPNRFDSAAGREGGPRSIVYQHAYQTRRPHGIAIVGGNDGRIERIAIYANHEMPTLG